MTYLYRIRCDTLIRISLAIDAYLRMASYHDMATTIWMIDPLFQSGNVGLTHFLMKHLGEVGTRKKRPASRVFFFLPAFGRCCPSVSAHPANRTRCSSNTAIPDHFPSKTFSRSFQTPLDRRGMLGMVSVYRVRTSTIAKNRHLNIVLRAELHLRTGTYDRPNLAKALAIDAYPCIAYF